MTDEKDDRILVDMAKDLNRIANALETLATVKLAELSKQDVDIRNLKSILHPKAVR